MNPANLWFFFYAPQADVRVGGSIATVTISATGAGEKVQEAEQPGSGGWGVTTPTYPIQRSLERAHKQVAKKIASGGSIATVEITATGGGLKLLDEMELLMLYAAQGPKLSISVGTDGEVTHVAPGTVMIPTHRN